MEEKTELQAKTPLWEDPKLTLADVGEKWSALDREVSQASRLEGESECLGISNNFTNFEIFL